MMLPKSTNKDIRLLLSLIHRLYMQCANGEDISPMSLYIFDNSIVHVSHSISSNNCNICSKHYYPVKHDALLDTLSKFNTTEFLIGGEKQPKHKGILHIANIGRVSNTAYPLVKTVSYIPNRFYSPIEIDQLLELSDNLPLGHILDRQ